MTAITSRPATLRLSKLASLVGSPVALLATAITYAGTDDMHIQTAAGWQLGLLVSLTCLMLPWVLYILQREPDQVITAGFSSMVMMLGIFWLMGFMGYYFYFGFAPMKAEYRALALCTGLLLSIHWAVVSFKDVRDALSKDQWMSRLYVEESCAYIYNQEVVQAFASIPRDRTPIRSVHMGFAIALTPFIVVLNRILTPYTGSGHGVFLVLSFLGLPMSLWIISMAVRVYVLMIHYPIKLQRQTGKPVLMRGFD